MQLRFTSFAVINLRRDFHPQECAHAGRTKKRARRPHPGARVRKAAMLRMFQAIVTSDHSPSTALRPRSRNCRKPMTVAGKRGALLKSWNFSDRRRHALRQAVSPSYTSTIARWTRNMGWPSGETWRAARLDWRRRAFSSSLYRNCQRGRQRSKSGRSYRSLSASGHPTSEKSRRIATSLVRRPSSSNIAR